MIDRQIAAARAKEILEDEVFAEALEMVKTKHFNDWLTCTLGTEAREMLWHRTRGDTELITALRTIRDRGVQQRLQREAS